MIKNLSPRLAEAGKIKIGGLGETRTAASGREYRVPVGYDHFVITKTRRDAKGDLEIDVDLMEALERDKDGKIRAIPIILHSDEIEDVFPTSYSFYAGKRLFCRGDGELATRYEIDQGTKRHTGKSESVPCTCKYLTGAQKRCKPHGTLRCSIAAPNRAVAGAVHLWRTTSMISIERLIGSLQQIHSICGTLRGLPLWLKLEPVTVSPEDAPTKEVHCCHIELRATDLLAVQREALEAKRMRDTVAGIVSYPAQLVEPTSDDGPDEQEAIGDEFHPDDADAVPPYHPETGEVFDDGWTPPNG